MKRICCRHLCYVAGRSWIEISSILILLSPAWFKRESLFTFIIITLTPRQVLNWIKSLLALCCVISDDTGCGCEGHTQKD